MSCLAPVTVVAFTVFNRMFLLVLAVQNSTSSSENKSVLGEHTCNYFLFKFNISNIKSPKSTLLQEGKIINSFGINNIN